MSAETELGEVVEQGVRRGRRMIFMAIEAQANLRKALKKGDPDAEEFRDCKMSDEDWQFIKPAVGLLFGGEYLPNDQYALLRDTIMDYADEFGRLLADKLE